MAKVEITINGKAYPCRQTMGAMLRFKQVMEFADSIDPDAMTAWEQSINGDKKPDSEEKKRTKRSK